MRKVRYSALRSGCHSVFEAFPVLSAVSQLPASSGFSSGAETQKLQVVLCLGMYPVPWENHFNCFMAVVSWSRSFPSLLSHLPLKWR